MGIFPLMHFNRNVNTDNDLCIRRTKKYWAHQFICNWLVPDAWSSLWVWSHWLFNLSCLSWISHQQKIGKGIFIGMKWERFIWSKWNRSTAQQVPESVACQIQMRNKLSPKKRPQRRIGGWYLILLFVCDLCNPPFFYRARGDIHSPPSQQPSQVGQALRSCLDEVHLEFHEGRGFDPWPCWHWSILLKMLLHTPCSSIISKTKIWATFCAPHSVLTGHWPDFHVSPLS